MDSSGDLVKVKNITYSWPGSQGGASTVLTNNGSGTLTWGTATTGTVTSVNLTQPAAGITVSGGPVTASGSITLALADDLAAVEGISTTGGVERTALNTWSTYTLSAAGKALIDDADATAQRTTLGLGALATAAAASGGTAGTITDDTITNADINSAAAIATTKLSGAVTSIASHGLGSLATLSAVSGGTGTTITDDTITDADINSAAAIATSKLSGAVTSISGHGLSALATASAVSGGAAGTITDDTITNADINSAAGIVDTKLATISTAGKVSGSAITSGTIAGSTIFNSSGTITTSSSITGLGVNGTTLMAGTGDAGASPAGGTLRAASGAGSNITGSNLTVTAGNGTGTGGSGSILFQTAPVAGSSSTANTMATRMTILNDGNVGIGTTTPGANLHVFANNETSSSITAGPSAVLGPSLILNNGGSGGRAYKITSTGTSNGPGAGFLEFYDQTASTTRMVIKSDGNVGIGTSGPVGLLDVRGAIMAGSGLNNTSARPAVGSTRIAGEIAGFSAAGLGADDGFLRLSGGGGSSGSSKSYIDISGFSTVGDMNANIVLGTAGTERLRILNNGNVGIGTTAPISKLEVTGTIVSTVAATLTPTGTTQTLDLATSNTQNLNLGSATGTVTLTLSNPVVGATYMLTITQGATPRSVTWPAAVKWEGGTPVALSGANAADVITLFYNGTNYFAVASKNFL